MIVQAELVQGVSKKSGKPYVMVRIPLAEGYTKCVFLDRAEEVLCKITYNNDERSN